MAETMKKESGKKQHHFVLVHGFSLGAWCWYKVVALMKSQGHRVTALDLAGCGVHPTHLNQIRSISDYVQPLMDFLTALPNHHKVILIAHSYGGLPLSLAMETFPEKISLAVFVAAYMPNCRDPPATLVQEYFRRASSETFMDCQFTFEGSLPIWGVFGPDYMGTKLFAHCPSEDLELGKMLVRPNKLFVEEIGKGSMLSEECYGSIRRCYVVCEGDEVMEEGFQRYNVDGSPPDDVLSVQGAGHMAMLSQPHQLCSCLLQLADKYLLYS